MNELKKEIENILYKYLTSTNINRLTIDKNEYNQFLNTVLQCILDVRHTDLISLLEQSIIDNRQNIEKYSNILLDLYFKNDIKHRNSFISDLNKNQRIIFWYKDTYLYKYISLYPIHALLSYKDNIVLFYRNKKSDKQPYAIVVKNSGEELFTINFPTKNDNECVNDDISYYGVKINKDGIVMQSIFTNGDCRLDFWCSYNLIERKYIDSNFWK